MKKFMDDDFLLSTDTAKELFRAAKEMPIFDWHCHLSPKEIYENKNPDDIAELWLSYDHYKWRAMRSFGIDEKYITGDADGYDKFKAWAKTMPYLIGNPLYHWTHLELQRYFGIYKTLSPETCDEIWEKCNAKIKKGGFSPRELIEKSGVVCVCTTDDPADTLEYHKLLAKDKSFSCRVLPAFRPEKALGIDSPAFVPWLSKLENTAGVKIDSYETLKKVLKDRIRYFDSVGCLASDHSFSYIPYARCEKEELQEIFKKGAAGEKLTVFESDCYKTDLLTELAKEYASCGWVMELHVGALRNNNTRMFEKIGADSGFDSIDDCNTASGLSKFLDSLDRENSLPKTVLFNLNPRDNFVYGSMIGNFQGSGNYSKIQYGAAWWFNDNYDGMRKQLATLANLGCLGKFIGMVTDSRSFLSYPRHEYFRRILCEYIGDLVEEGKYPHDTEFLKKVAEDISYNNAAAYFGI
ncbi:MAG: glucuronate isomerase [Ruminococcus sp.]|nr:glucuronate isomerase [Ruminococcus sp.]MDY3895145.1 glucuronate isomerase [Candidatus Fimenecus sp.]